MSCVALDYAAITRFALWSGLYVIYNPVASFDLRCQKWYICLYHGNLQDLRESIIFLTIQEKP